MNDYEQSKSERGSGNRNNPTRKAILYAKTEIIERESRQEKKIKELIETMGNKKYIDDGILARVLGINTVNVSELTSKDDIVSYNYGYYRTSNTLIIPGLCEGYIPSRVYDILKKKRIQLDRELYPEELLKEIGTRDSYDENINIEDLPEHLQTNATYMSGYNKNKAR